MKQDVMRAEERESLPIEQGARDTMQYVINALHRARDGRSQFEVVDNLTTAIERIGVVLQIQRLEVNDFAGQGDYVRRVVMMLMEDQ